MQRKQFLVTAQSFCLNTSWNIAGILHIAQSPFECVICGKTKKIVALVRQAI